MTEQVLAYQRKRLADHEVLDLIALDLPADLVHHAGALVRAARRSCCADDFPLHALLGALHAAEHSQIAVLPLLAMCDRWDIGGLSTNLHPQTGGPTIFIYDGHPGGIGITRRGFLAFDALVDDAHRLISECPCEKGCPSCVQSPKCGNLNEPLSKRGRGRGHGPYARRRMTDDFPPRRRASSTASSRRGGVRMHVAEAGAGEPLLLVHGWPQHWYEWRGVVAELAGDVGG